MIIISTNKPNYSARALNTQQIGILGEALAGKYLVKSGWNLIAQSFRFNHIEIDLIAHREQIVGIFEVKTRLRSFIDNQDLLATLGHRKIYNLKQAAQIIWKKRHTISKEHCNLQKILQTELHLIGIHHIAYKDSKNYFELSSAQLNF